METKPSVYMYVCIYNVIDTQIRKRCSLYVEVQRSKLVIITNNYSLDIFC